MTKKIIIIAMLVMVCCGAAAAKREDLPKYILDQLHNDIKYDIITERNIKDVDRFVADHSPRRFIVFQAKPDSVTPEAAKKLMQWVKDGGVLWFYDSRLAKYFGMENAPLKEDKFRGKKHRGEYGTQKVHGLNAIAQTLDFVKNPVATGVQSIQVFIMSVGPDSYSAVSTKTPGVESIAQVNLEKKAVIAMKKVGKGRVVFKPLVWLDVLGGERFQANLLEFSGGYEVPKSKRPIIPPEALKGKKKVKLSRYDNIYLSDGQQVVGKIEEKTFQYVGDKGAAKIAVKDIDKINRTPTATIIRMKDGKRINGTLMTLSLKFKTLTGKRVDLNKEDVVSIDFDIGQMK